MTAGGIDESAAAAQAAYDAGELDRGRELARAGLAENPGEPRLLRLLGLVAVEEGDLEVASEAFAKVLDVAPGDGVALVHLAHTKVALGQPDTALGLLSRAADADDAPREALRALVSLAERRGHASAARDAAARLVALDPKDVSAALALADLHLAGGDLDDAARAFAAVRSIDDDEGHALFAMHGEAEALLSAGRWRAALDVAIEATRLDRLQLTTDVLRFAAAKLFGESDRPAPPWEVLKGALAEERSLHRRVHAEQEVL